jgi:putative Mn2+ efflux pump MntP
MKILTVNDLHKLCEKLIAKGNGDKKIMIHCDNGSYKELHSDFTPAEAVFGDEEKCDCSVRARDMIAPAFATSIDALVVGIAMAMAAGKEGGLNVFLSVFIIGVVTFLLCVMGTKIGGIFGEKYKKPAEISGGIILVLIGVKTVLEHLEIINF